MKKYLLPESGKFYKANLHCHTTVSDGKLSPEQVKEAYKSRGYSVIAYTDHDVMIPHDELNDGEFLALHGYEIELSQWDITPHKFRKTCHLCLIPIKKDNIRQVCWHREKYMIGHGAEYRDQVVFNDSLPDFERYYTPECVNEVIDTARKNGFFVTYNHPVWSMENYNDYMSYNGMNAMEICNHSCCDSGFNDYNGRIYDEMLRGGKRLFCIGADDNHNARPVDSNASGSFGAFVEIKAPSLAYEDITGALVRGDFYASQGPEIKELYYEDGKVFVSTSPCEKIILTTGTRATRIAFREKRKRRITSAALPVQPDEKYFRITVLDKYGCRADSNAYFLDEIL